jgi:hypothetical protein
VELYTRCWVFPPATCKLNPKFQVSVELILWLTAHSTSHFHIAIECHQIMQVSVELNFLSHCSFKEVFSLVGQSIILSYIINKNEFVDRFTKQTIEAYYCVHVRMKRPTPAASTH